MAITWLHVATLALPERLALLIHTLARDLPVFDVPKRLRTGFVRYILSFNLLACLHLSTLRLLPAAQAAANRRISVTEYRDKMKGGWIGHMSTGTPFFSIRSG